MRGLVCCGFVKFCEEHIMDKTVEIIILVERNPVLYDKTESNYKDAIKKQDVWKEIGKKVGLTGKRVESRWRTVRDNYVRYRRKLKRRSGDAANTVREYKYAKVMSFLIPHFVERSTSSNLAEDLDDDQLQSDNFTDEDDDASQAADLRRQQNRLVTPKNSSTASSSHSKRKNLYSPSDVDTLLCEYLKNKSCSPVKTEEKADSVDLFLQSMAGAIRKLPAQKRSDVKFKIHNIVHEAEMQCSFPEIRTPSDMSSTSARLNLTSTRLMLSPAPRICSQ